MDHVSHFHTAQQYLIQTVASIDSKALGDEMTGIYPTEQFISIYLRPDISKIRYLFLD